MIFEVYTIADKKLWNKRLSEFKSCSLDIYYKPEYFETWATEEDAEIYCIYANIAGSKFLYPFFKKEIHGFNLPEKYFDIFSAYGYGGVVSFVLDNESTILFNSRFNKWCHDNNVVAEFIRENPAINSREEFIRDAEYSKVRTNVYLKSTDEYVITTKSRKRNIATAQKNDLKIEIDENLESIDSFIQLYRLTASRLSMSKNYLFKDSYFYNNILFLKNNVKIINIKYQGKVIASTLFYYAFGKTVYHLSGSDFNFRKYCPNDLLLYAMIEESKKLDNALLSFGGGTSDDPDDNLFIFKSKFGNEFRDVYIGKKVHNELYHKFCSEWAKSNQKIASKYKQFFLKYRIKE